MSTHTETGLAATVLDAGEIAERPRDAMSPGVTYTILWREGKSAAGLMWLEPGAVVPEHTHAAAVHHVWLVEGRVRIEGRSLAPGAYWHVPAGVPHEVEAVEPHGATLFYLYLRR